jgi:hypothetical protein
MQNGKGDRNRTTNWRSFRDGMDRIKENECKSEPVELDVVEILIDGENSEHSVDCSA